MQAALGLVALGLFLMQPLPAADIEPEARELEAALIAPCCFSQQVSVHHSPAADEVRVDIRRRLAAGETRDEILGAYVAQHGRRILAVPPDEGFDRILHLLPPLGLLLTAGLLALVFRRFTASRVPEPAPGGTDRSQDERYGEALDDELRDLD